MESTGNTLSYTTREKEREKNQTIEQLRARGKRTWVCVGGGGNIFLSKQLKAFEHIRMLS